LGVNETGWAVLRVSSSGSSSDDVQAFSAGFVEGYLTAPLIEPYIRNVFSHRFHDPTSADPNVTKVRASPIFSCAHASSITRAQQLCFPHTNIAP
jgi:hypothetical protein